MILVIIQGCDQLRRYTIKHLGVDHKHTYNITRNHEVKHIHMKEAHMFQVNQQQQDMLGWNHTRGGDPKLRG
jgi:hypothetical protein